MFASDPANRIKPAGTEGSIGHLARAITQDLHE